MNIDKLSAWAFLLEKEYKKWNEQNMAKNIEVRIEDWPFSALTEKICEEK